MDYDRLVKEFGLEKINDVLIDRIKKHIKEMHLFLRRKVFFSHRDIQRILEAIKNKQKFVMITNQESF